MDSAEVSVIIPTYNRAYCLEGAIDSVLAQSHRQCRALIIDDGSSDDTRALVAKRYGADPRVVYEYQCNQGVVAARNRGLALASGEYVAFLDSDDRWQPWKVELQLACLRQLPPSVGMIWTDMDAIDSDGKVVHERYLKMMYSAYARVRTESIFAESASLASLAIDVTGVDASVMVYWGEIFSAMVRGNLVHTSTALLRRERARQVGLFDSSLRVAGEDFDYHLRTCRAGSVAFVDARTVLYRVGNPDQLTAPAYAVTIAENFLKTIAPVIARDRARITLSRAVIRETLARAHRWIAETRFAAGDGAAARRHAWRSLLYEPWQRRSWLILAYTALPRWSRQSALRAYRALKK